MQRRAEWLYEPMQMTSANRGFEAPWNRSGGKPSCREVGRATIRYRRPRSRPAASRIGGMAALRSAGEGPAAEPLRYHRAACRL
jgi:hypothetical protein